MNNSISVKGGIRVNKSFDTVTSKIIKKKKENQGVVNLTKS